MLERARLGELPAAEREALTRRLDREPELRERLAAIELSDGALRHRLEAARMAARLRARPAAPGEGRTAFVARWRGWPLPAGLAVAATAALVLSLRTSVTTPRVDPGTSSRPAPTSPAPTSTSVPVPPSRPEPSVSSTAPATRPSTGEPA